MNPAHLIPQALAAVQAVYRDLTELPIERNCQLVTECCQFKLTGLTPYLTKGEALLAAKAWKASGRTKLPEKTDGSCPMLEDKSGRCLIYESRPFGCRTHFCKAAGGPYARRDVLHLIHRLEEIDADVEGDGTHPLPLAMKRALRE